MFKMNLPVISELREELVTINNQKMLNFSSNDYLGFSQNDELKEQMVQAVHMFGLGSTGSRRLSGNHDLFLSTEQKYADWLQKESAVYFNSGYQMNSAIFEVLTSKDTLIIADKLIHASLIDGIQRSSAVLKRFQHNNITHLKQLIEKYNGLYNTIFVLVEGIYSMDGDQAPLNEIVKLKSEYKFKLIVDEAHSIGIMGPQGKGLIHHLNLQSDVEIILITFGKAFGMAGGMLLSSSELVDTIKTKCRSYIYSTAQPLPMIWVINAAMDLMIKSDYEREKLNKNICSFKRLFNTDSSSPIQPIKLGSKHRANIFEEQLLGAGLFVRAIHHPTVPKGASRLRVTITSIHSQESIEQFYSQFKKVEQRVASE